ncbi:hypothetical protein, partial [Mycobacterium senriense]
AAARERAGQVAGRLAAPE